jgi:hypothetical protein
VFGKVNTINFGKISNAPNLTEADINMAKSTITKDTTAKLIGEIAHLAYWSVFGHLNHMGLDTHHRRQLFV